MNKSFLTRVLVLVIGTTFFASCSSTKISSDIDSSKDFAVYKTYYLNNLEDDNLIISDLDQKRINQSIERELNRAGFTKVESIDESDITVDLSLALQVNRSANANSTSTGYATGGRRAYRGGMGMGNSNTSITTSQEVEGTLVLDLYETDSNDMVWRGVASKKLDSNISKREQNISKVVSKLFEKFPSNNV